MSNIVIRAEGLSKLYHIGERESYPTFRDTFMNFFRNPLAALGDNGEQPLSSRDRENEVWALKGVSFEVEQGEAVGIIGRNGAGKTTLLKILSRITDPTEGYAEIYGRVSSLLEVGTGFHPELTGRENIYLNGAILGMKRKEVNRKFDEIVAFAEVEKFIDTPVKHYSSGMYVRLAFAVAAHVETEILLVDELLAVGDVGFQKKCLGKMGAVANQGRTVLFVSHSMAAVNRLCRRGIWLHEGTTQMIGNADSVVTAYLATNTGKGAERVWENGEQAPGNDKIRLRAVRICTEEGCLTNTIASESGFLVEVVYDVLVNLPPMRIVVKVATADGTTVFLTRDNYRNAWETNPRQPGRYISRCHVPKDLLNEGSYTLTVSAEVPFVAVLFQQDDILGLIIERTGGVGGEYAESWPGVICPSLPWDVSKIDES